MSEKLTATEAAFYLGERCCVYKGDRLIRTETVIPQMLIDMDSMLTAFYTYKLLLRPLSDMTEEELMELCRVNTPKLRWDSIEIFDVDEHKIWYADGSMWHGDGVSELNDLHIYFAEMNPKSFAYLLSIGIDLFSWIESGKAIDKTKLK